MKKLLLFFLLAAPCFAQTFAGRAGNDVFITPPFRLCVGDERNNSCLVYNGSATAKVNGALDFMWPAVTVANLPSASANIGRTYRVTDGASPSDCTVGLGSTSTVCTSDGSAWKSIGGGANPAGSNGDIQTKNGTNLGSVSSVAVGSVLTSQGVGSPPAYQKKLVFDVRDCGAVGDGVTNDTTAVNTCIADAVASTAANGGTATVAFPSGTFLGCFTVVEGKGIHFQGAGVLSTVLESDGTCPAMQINGLWYSSFRDMSFTTKAALSINNGVLSIDANYDGTHHLTTQFVTFDTILVSGVHATSLSKYGITVCVLNGALQTCQGSNLTFINAACSGASTCYYQFGYNALSVQWIGGDVQNFDTTGMRIFEGGIQIIGTTFESTQGCLPLVNGGSDVDATGNGAGSSISLVGVRSEDYAVFNGSSTLPPNISGLTQTPSKNVWAAFSSYPLNYGYIAVGSDSKYHLFCVTTAGTTGGVQPTWPSSGTVNDGSEVWTTTAYNAVNISGNAGINTSNLFMDESAGFSNNTSSFTYGGLANFNNPSATPLYYPLTGSSNGLLYRSFSASSFLDLITQGRGVALFNSSAGYTDPLTGTSVPIGLGIVPISATEDNFWLGNGLKEQRNGRYLFTTGVPVSAQTVPTITGCGTISSQTGGGTAGTFVTNATSCTPVLTSMPFTANGYSCILWDRTNPTLPMGNISSGATSATFGTITTTASDVIAFQCGLGY